MGRRARPHEEPDAPKPRRARTSAPLCSLAEWLLERWTWGALSAAMVQEAAYQAYLDGLTHESICLLASAGTWGAHKGNVQRDLERRVLPNLNCTPEPYVHQIQALNPKSDRTEQCTVTAPVLLPHEWIACLSENAPECFERTFGLAKVPEFWEHADLQDPKMKLHVHLDSFCVPLWVHGDGAEYQNRDSLNIISFSGALGVGCTKDRKLLCTTWSKDCSAQTRHGYRQDTWRDGLWPVLVWSFKACIEGKFPASDHLGRPFAEDSFRAQRAGQPLCTGGWRFFVHGFLGDLDYFSKDLDLPSHNSHEPCWFCKANCTDNPWNDFRTGARWQQGRTIRDVQRNPRSAHPIWSIPGLHEMCTMLDVLHVVDLGVATHVVGNVLHTIIYEQLCAGPPRLRALTPQEALGRLWTDIQQIYQELGTQNRLHNLKLSMFTDARAPFAAFPCLTSVKAADTRHLVPVVHELCKRYVTGEERTQHRLLCAKRLTHFYEVLHMHEGVFLPREASALLFEHTKILLVHYSWLASDACARGKLNWSIVPKHHFMWHLAEQARFVHPRCTWTYLDEDFMNVIVHIARSSSSVGMLQIADAVVLKYRAAMQLRMQQGLQGH